MNEGDSIDLHWLHLTELILGNCSVKTFQFYLRDSRKTIQIN